MTYLNLTKLYYKNFKEYEANFINRYNSPFSKHLNINIKQYNHNNSFPAFFNYTEDIVLLIEQIYKAYEKLLYTIHSVPPVVLHQFSLQSILEEVKSTNDIEGVHSTRKELRAILDGNVPHTARFYSVVHKYNSLLTDAEIQFNTCKDIRNFYDDFAHKEIAEENPDNKLDGEMFRKGSVDVASTSGKTIHQGINPETNILTTMQDALNILNDKELPFLIRISLFHYLFAYIHPFYDGNGRTDRFITSYYLSKHFHKIAALRLSVTIKKKKNKTKYYALFLEADSEINRGDMTPFIIGFLELLLETFNDTIEILTRKQAQLEVYENKINNLNLNDKLLSNIYYILLHAALFYGQGISITELANITNKARGTIQTRLDAIPPEHLTITKNSKTKYYKLNSMLFKTE